MSVSETPESWIQAELKYPKNKNSTMSTLTERIIRIEHDVLNLRKENNDSLKLNSSTLETKNKNDVDVNKIINTLTQRIASLENSNKYNSTKINEIVNKLEIITPRLDNSATQVVSRLGEGTDYALSGFGLFGSPKKAGGKKSRKSRKNKRKTQKNK